MFTSPCLTDRAWLAGFFEADGSVCLQKPPKNQPKRVYHRVVLSMSQVDPEPLRRVESILPGLGSLGGPYQYKHRPFYLWSARTLGEVQTILGAMWPWLSQRRKDQAKKALMGCVEVYKGEHLPSRCKFTSEQALEIIKSSESHSALARKHGVSHQTIRAIRRGKTYKHLSKAKVDALARRPSE